MELSGAIGVHPQRHKKRMMQCPNRLGLLLVQGKERDWWSVDLEGGMEKLEVEGLLSRTEAGSVDPKRKMGHWSARKTTGKEGREKLKGAENEKTGKANRGG